MTVIIGYVDKQNDTVYMGADSRTSQSTYVDTWNDQKVFIKGDFLLGACGTLRGLNVLKYQFEPPEHPENMSVEQYINSLFINELQYDFTNLGVKEFDKDEGIELSSTLVLVGYKGRLFEIGADFSVHESTGFFRTIGSGGQIALGVLLATEDDMFSIEHKIYNALSLTSMIDAGVGPPYVILKLPSGGNDATD